MKRTVMKPVVYISILGFLFIGCVVDDADRCLGKYTWNAAQSACVPKSDNIDTDTINTVDTATTTSSESEVEVSSDTQPEQGLGEVCNSDAECVGFEASYCMLNPMSPGDPGICTISDCDADVCGEDYTCCDCSSSAILNTWTLPLCIPNENVSNLTMAGCTC